MTTQLLGPNGKPISSAMFNKKTPAPTTGDKFGQWGGPNAATQAMTLPGGGILQFNLDGLELGDFRQMRDHYQISSSLSVLMFLMHQIEFKVKCSDKKQEEFYNEQINSIWTPLVRSLSTAFWAGFSPNILNWDNNVSGGRVELTKIKDLLPENSMVNWKKQDGAGTTKISVYDGIKEVMGAKPIPVDNTFWYPLLMENGNYAGRKLLRSAFQPWFFSQLLHLFANRYYERFGEPTPVGRAPYDDDIKFQGTLMSGNQAMEQILNQLRNRSVVVLPNDKTPFGDETTIDYDYQIEYLESQMRGADFERYMTRLDEEMSLALFTPILLMRTADVGSYNLGTQHSIIYQWILNAIAGDWKFYIDWYILRPMRNFNFGTNAPRPEMVFRRMGAQNQDVINNIVTTLIAGGQAKPNFEQLGEMAGLELTEIKQLAEDPQAADSGGASGSGGSGSDTENTGRTRGVVALLSERIEPQIRNAFRRSDRSNFEFSLGYQAQMESALKAEGDQDAFSHTRVFFASIEQILKDLIATDVYDEPVAFSKKVRNDMDSLVDMFLQEAA